MTPHPSTGFLKYLMTSQHPQASNDMWVSSTVMSLGFPVPDPDYMIWLRSGMDSRKPANLQIGNRYHKESSRFLRQEGIWSLHYPDAGAREAALIVTDLRARPIIESLLLGRVEHKELTKKLNARLGVYFTVNGIEAYANYYWNTKLLRVEDWEKLYESYDTQKQHALSIVQVGPAMAMHKMGFQQHIESKNMLHEILDGLYFDFKEWKSKPLSESRTKAFTAIAKAAVTVDIQLSQADSALKDSLKAFEQFRMQHAQAQVQDVRTLAPDGNFSGSGSKLLEAHAPSDEEKS